MTYINTDSKVIDLVRDDNEDKLVLIQTNRSGNCVDNIKETLEEKHLVDNFFQKVILVFRNYCLNKIVH